jgi:CO/xanthine dehydrogenase Mo-binding subunit
LRCILCSLIQATGEAVYLDDVELPGELHSAFVVSTVASATIKRIDPSKALAQKGVMAFLSAASIAADGFCNLAR